MFAIIMYLCLYIKSADDLLARGATIERVSLPTTKLGLQQLYKVQLLTKLLALPCYYIIALAESASNLARYDGMEYGTLWPAADY